VNVHRKGADVPNVRELLVVKPAGAVAGTAGGIAFRALTRRD
jgi:hypothetical protein